MTEEEVPFEEEATEEAEQEEDESMWQAKRRKVCAAVRQRMALEGTWAGLMLEGKTAYQTMEEEKQLRELLKVR